MAKWKEIPLGKVKNLFIDEQEKLEDKFWSGTVTLGASPKS